MNERRFYQWLGGINLREVLRCARRAREALACGDTTGAILAYLDGIRAHGDSFMRAPRTSRERVLRALLAAKKPLVETCEAAVGSTP